MDQRTLAAGFADACIEKAAAKSAPAGKILSAFFYEAKSVKLKICSIGSTFYPSFHDGF